MINAMRRHPIHALLVLLCLFLCSVALQAQTATQAPDTSLLPGPKPADVPTEWKQLVGVYGADGTSDIIVLERNQRLFWHTHDGNETSVLPSAKNGFKFAIDGQTDFVPVTDPAGKITGLEIASRESPLYRKDAGADPAHYFHITPITPVEQLRAAALASNPPAEPAPFRKPDLVELATLDPAIHLDIRYAQSNNFLSTPVYTQARAFLQRPAAEALFRVLQKLRPRGYGLLIHDAYRPWYVTKIFWDATPPEDHNFVADPQKGSRHNRGCAVDLTLYDLTSGKPIEMPGLYDEMSPRSFPNFPGGTSLQRWHRDLLRRAMESEGFTVNEDEWWHFDYKDWKQYPILNVPFERLQFTSRKNPAHQ
jgi:D-alanyl-D-alanine dipeptidase